MISPPFLNTIITQSACRPRLIWCCFLFVVVAVALPGLTRSPPPWQDEVQILDYGRGFLDGQTDGAAVSFVASEQRPIHPLSYLGCVASELAYRTLKSAAGPRLLALGGAMLFSTMLLLGMLRSATDTVGPLVALLICGSMFLEPLSFQSFRGARLDALAIAMVVGAWRLIERKEGEQCWWRFAVGGSLVGLSFFVWPRIIIAWPLVMLPLLVGRDAASLRKSVKPVAWLALGFICSFAIALPPAMKGLDDLRRWDDNPMGAMPALHRLVFAGQTFVDMSRPHIPLALTGLIGCIALVVHRSRHLMGFHLGWFGCGVMTLAAFVASATPLHHFNLIYLGPLLALLTWAGWQELSSNRRAARALLMVLMLMFASNFALSVILRSAVALRRSDPSGTDDWHQIVSVNDRILAPSFTPYYALRAVGVIPFCYVIGKEGMDDAGMLKKLNINVLIIPTATEDKEWVQSVISSFGPQPTYIRLKSGQTLIRRTVGI